MFHLGYDIRRQLLDEVDLFSLNRPLVDAQGGLGQIDEIDGFWRIGHPCKPKRLTGDAVEHLHLLGCEQHVLLDFLRVVLLFKR